MKYDKKKIQALNRAYQKLKEGFALLKENTHKDGDIDTHIWRMEKALEKVNKIVMKEMSRDSVDHQFKKIIEKYSG